MFKRRFHWIKNLSVSQSVYVSVYDIFLNCYNFRTSDRNCMKLYIFGSIFRQIYLDQNLVCIFQQGVFLIGVLATFITGISWFLQFEILKLFNFRCIYYNKIHSLNFLQITSMQFLSFLFFFNFFLTFFFFFTMSFKYVSARASSTQHQLDGKIQNFM